MSGDGRGGARQTSTAGIEVDVAQPKKVAASLSWAYLCSRTSGYEHCRRRRLDVRSVPGTGRVDHRLSGVECHRPPRTPDLLVQRDVTLNAEHQLIAIGMHLPGVPGPIERVHRDEPAFKTIIAVRFSVSRIPPGCSVELVEAFDTSAKPEMRRVLRQVECFATHRASFAQARDSSDVSSTPT